MPKDSPRKEITVPKTDITGPHSETAIAHESSLGW